jgi:hypothetical protein
MQPKSPSQILYHLYIVYQGTLETVKLLTSSYCKTTLGVSERIWYNTHGLAASSPELNPIENAWAVEGRIQNTQQWRTDFLLLCENT